MAVINRSHEWEVEFDGGKLQEIEDEKSLLATFALVVRELAIKCPNDQELGAEVRQ